MKTRFITVKNKAGTRRAVPLRVRTGSKSACPVKARYTGMAGLKSAVAADHAARLTKAIDKIQTSEGLEFMLNYTGKKYAGDEADVRAKLTKHLIGTKDKRLAEDMQKIAAVENAPDFSGEFIVTVDWAKSRTWGLNPQARTDDGFVSERIGGCGYDKLSTAVGQALDSHLPLMKLLYAKKEKDYGQWKGLGSQSDYNHKVLGYGSGYSILPEFEGGVGVSAYENIIAGLGLEMRHLSSTPGSDVFMISRAR